MSKKKQEEKKGVLGNLKDRIFSGGRTAETTTDENATEVERVEPTAAKKPANSFSAALEANRIKRQQDVKRIQEAASTKMDERTELEQHFKGHGQGQD